ncbi:MAG: hypothetical protein KA957_05990 [Syntrophaceae bacterium]|nr:hypothetical protein [Syntrophaceae bacterium]
MHRYMGIFLIAVFALIAAGVCPPASWADQAATASIEQTFQKARQEYLDKNMTSAAEQIQKGAAYMKDQASKASAKGKDALAASARELDQLAVDVKKGAVTSQKKMEDAFARAYLALANDAHIQSTESWAKKKRVEAAAALETANRNLEKSIAWTGGKIEKGTNEVVKKSDALALKLRQKGDLLADDVSRGLQEAGNEIEKFGKKISPR